MSREKPTAGQVRDAVASMVERVAADIGVDDNGNGMSGVEGDADFWWSDADRLSECKMRILTEFGDAFILTIARDRGPTKGRK